MAIKKYCLKKNVERHGARGQEECTNFMRHTIFIINAVLWMFKKQYILLCYATIILLNNCVTLLHCILNVWKWNIENEKWKTQKNVSKLLQDKAWIMFMKVVIKL